MAEPSVEKVERLPDKEIGFCAVNVLRQCYRNAPYPKASVVSRWTFAGGAFANISIGSTSGDYDVLAALVGQRSTVQLHCDIALCNTAHMQLVSEGDTDYVELLQLQRVDCSVLFTKRRKQCMNSYSADHRKVWWSP